jgi:hypothetical protein
VKKALRPIDDPYFEPRQRASRRRRLVFAAVFTFVWAVALAATAYIALTTDAIALGLLIAVGSFLVAGILLGIVVIAREHRSRPARGRVGPSPQAAGRT